MTGGRTAGLPRAYLDTSVISGFARQDLPSPEQEATNQLFQLVQHSNATVCTSTEALGEFQAVPEEHRGPHIEQYNRIAVLKKAAEGYPTEEVYTPEAQRILTDLRQAIPDEVDARHIAHAAMHGVYDFVTTDRRTILRHAPAIRQASGVSVWSPTEYLAQISRGST